MVINYLYIAGAIILFFYIVGGIIYYLIKKRNLQPTPSPTPSPTQPPDKTCPNNCNKRGPCVKGICECGGDWYGTDCSTNCVDTEGGTCDDNGVLKCKTGWSPEGKCNCNLSKCKGGICQSDGSCKCNNDNFNDPTCSICKTGFYGPNCDLTAAANCNNRGIPNKSDGSCTCNDDKSSGKNCEYTREVNCNNLGFPNMDGSCRCDQNSYGTNCQINRNSFCNGNGVPYPVIDFNGIPTGEYRCTCDSTDYIVTPEEKTCKYKKRDCAIYGGTWNDGLGCLCPDGRTTLCYPFCSSAERAACIKNCSDAYEQMAKDPAKKNEALANLVLCQSKCIFIK